ncbi:hypothetical protein ABIC47_003700 [Leifsonia sp. 563]|uniref:hypothetical protein n=1 Tax=Leifsonia sp. 563 TaxID=3156412 RepID=UPI0033977BEC
MIERTDVTPEETDLLAGTRYDDVSLVWALIHLGIRTNPPPTPDWRPSDDDIAAAFGSFEKLSALGLISVGRMEYIDGGPPGRHAPVRHVPEALEDVRARVQSEVAASEVATDWEFACWIVATEAGLGVAEEASVEIRPRKRSLREMFSRRSRAW